MQPAWTHIGRTVRDRLTHWMVAGATLAAADSLLARMNEARRAMAGLPRAAPQPHLFNAKEWMPRLRRSDGIRRHAAANRAAGILE